MVRGYGWAMVGDRRVRLGFRIVLHRTISLDRALRYSHRSPSHQAAKVNHINN